MIHDQWGNVLAELDASGQTVREYIWLPETEIVPTRQSRAQVDRPIAVVTDVATASPTLLFVHVDHLNRPVRMTTGAKASVWAVEWSPWGTPHSITGAETLDARFPGQWFQLEAGLHYNWHRHYDPSLGRYTQPDPLGFVDGPSVYGYAGNRPIAAVDRDGRFMLGLPLGPLGPSAATRLFQCGAGSSSSPPLPTIPLLSRSPIIPAMAMGCDGPLSRFSPFCQSIEGAGGGGGSFGGGGGGPSRQFQGNKNQQKIDNQMRDRAWTRETIEQAITSGTPYPATNKQFPQNGATRYVHPDTGKSVVIDNKTGGIIHIGGPGFEYK